MRHHMPGARTASAIPFLWLLTLCLLAGPAFAQIGGMPGVNPADSRMFGHDWKIESDDLTGADLGRVKLAYEKGVKYLQKGECRKADLKFSYVLSVLPDNAEANYLAGATERCLGDFEAAVGHYETAIEKDPSMYLAYKHLGVSYLALREVEMALEQLASLETLRVECDESCPEELDAAYTDFKSTIEKITAK
jgi:tetratricopeptide (TPR) repeat protein